MNTKKQTRGRPPGSGKGRNAKIASISMLPDLWEKVDFLRGEKSRSAYIADLVTNAPSEAEKWLDGKLREGGLSLEILREMHNKEILYAAYKSEEKIFLNPMGGTEIVLNDTEAKQLGKWLIEISSDAEEPTTQAIGFDELKWTPFFFESFGFFAKIRKEDDWNLLKIQFPHMSTDQLLDAKEDDGQNTIPSFGFKPEYNGDRTLREFFQMNGMKLKSL